MTNKQVIQILKNMISNQRIMTAEMYEALDMAIEVLNLDVVRCKDCKYHDPEDKKCDCGHDIYWQLPRPDEWFCADGESR